MPSNPSRYRRSRFTSRTSTRAKSSDTTLSPQRVVSARSADLAQIAITSDWTPPLSMWKLPPGLMAKPGKAKANGPDGNVNENELVTMARGLAEIVAAHNLSELIVDTKETTLTIRRGGMAMAMQAMPAMSMPMQMQMPSMPSMQSAPSGPSAAPAA